MFHNFMQVKSIKNNSEKIFLCIFLLMVSLTVTPVSAVAPVVNFVGTPTSGATPLTVSFADLSSNTPTGWAWFFGDEYFTTPWKQLTASSGWSARSAHSSVTMPDGSIVLMGGWVGSVSGFTNDTWRSTDNGATWTQLTARAGWTPRAGHSSVVMPDGSIVLMGGGAQNHSFSKNDVWRSTDNGSTWKQLTARAGWTPRLGQSSVVMHDGSIILMGGGDSMVGGLKNDVWRSTDKGATWTQQTASAGWAPRSGQSSVVMYDDVIILMGGGDFVGDNVKNDTWRSTDQGATWTQVNASSGWSARAGHSSIVMPDGNIVLMGGGDSRGVKNDVWRLPDKGATWTQITASAEWKPRRDFTTVGLPSGNIILMGGIGDDNNNKNDVWRLSPAGSSAQNPSHTYTSTGTYKVALQAYNAGGYNSTRKTGYINATTAIAPVANFAGTPTTGTTPLTVSFTDLSLNSPTSWNWKFGDGSLVNATEKNPVHTYASAGTYSVSLTVTNSAGSNTIERTNYITVTSGVVTPVANFAGTPTTGTVPLNVQFTDATTGTPTGWAWFFGDETYTASWMQMTSGAGWSPRSSQTSVTMPDGGIVLMGGAEIDYNIKNDVWRSTDKGATWTQVNASAGWSKRWGHSSVVMPDGSLVLMGGIEYYNSVESYKNDVWRSTDNGATWTQITASAGWSGRVHHSSVAMPDGSIVLMGGDEGGNKKNDVWRSTDNGATWTKMTESAGWTARSEHSSVAMLDGSIVLIGGRISNSAGFKNDVWRSTDKGATWTQVNASADWSARAGHSSQVMPDGSIVLMGGRVYDSNSADGFKNDVWRSTDNGATWTDVNASAGWSARCAQSSVSMPDGSIVLMGGYDGSNKNDVWRFVPAGLLAQNPLHTYNTTGRYQVALQAYNAVGYNSVRKTGYITATSPTTATSTIGMYRNGVYYLRNTNTAGNADLAFTYGSTGDIPVTGDWNGDGIDTIGMYRGGMYYLRNSNTAGNADLAFAFGSPGDIPVTGDWNGDGIDTIGMYRNGVYFLRNTNTAGNADLAFAFGSPGDIPVTGDWNGDGVDTIGMYRNGVYFLRNTNTAGNADLAFAFGSPGDIPVTGDWNGDGIDTIGMYRNGVYYLRNTNTAGNADLAFTYGSTGDIPVTGKWV